MQAEELLAAQVRNPASVQHILDTSDVLADWHVGAPVLAAALLLPIVRQELAPVAQFDQDIVQRAQLAARLIYRDNTAENHREKLRQFFHHAYTHLDVTLIAVAARIASARQLSTMSEAGQHAWAEQTIEVYLPLMEMLGLWEHRDEMGNHSLVVRDPELYDDLANYAFTYYKYHEKTFGRIRNNLYQIFEENGLLGAEVTLHDLSQAGLYRKKQIAERNNLNFNLNDIRKLTIDVLVRTERECYLALGLIHNFWQPSHYQASLIDERFQDGIAAPGYNGYRALTTTVLCDSRPVKFRIRTFAMEEINKYGVVAARYRREPVKNAWWEHPHRLTSNERGIYVFTPTGEIIQPLKPGSTAVDLAFKIHSALGPYARQFWVNGQPVPHHQPLNSGDLIEIEYDHKYPSLKPDWVDFARTSTARDNMRRFLRRREQSPHKGRRLIDDVLKRETDIYEMRFPADQVETALTRIANRLNCPSLDALYLRVLGGTVAPDTVVAMMIEDELSAYIVLAETGKRPRVPVQIAQSWMQEKAPRKWHKSSRVMPGVEIVGRYRGKGKGRLVVHRKDSPHAPTGDEAVPLKWRTTKDVREAAEIDIIAKPESYVVGMVVNAVYSVSRADETQRLNIHRFHSELRENAMTINMVVDAPSFDGLHRLQDALDAVQRGGYIIDYKIWQLFPGQKLVLSGKQDKRRQNPYTVSRISDRAMFFGRADEIESIIEFLNNNERFIVIAGQKRIGKTSLLYQLCENIIPVLGENIVPVLFDAHSLGTFSTATFLLELAEVTHDRVLKQLKGPDERRGLRLRPRDLGDQPFPAFARWVKKIEQRLGGKHLLFVVDEFTTAEEKFDKGDINQDFFDGMQWLVGTQKIGFLLCVHDHIMKEQGGSWELLQRGQLIRLDTLDWKSAEHLVQQPIERIYKYESGVVERILQLTNCHPYFIHVLCQEIVKNVARRDGDRVTTDDLEKALQVMMTSGRHYFHHIYHRHTDGSFDMLRIIAYCTDGREWVSRDEIQAALQRYGMTLHPKQFVFNLGELARAEVIEHRRVNQAVMYRIKLQVFKLWMQRHVTDPIVSVDKRRED